MNCIDYYSGGDKPYLISGADDRLVKIWDYQVQFLYPSLYMLGLVFPASYSTPETWMEELFRES